MSAQVTIDHISYTIEKLDNGNLCISHPGGQLHPMQGPDTDGIHLFEVHPCQGEWYAYWNGLLPAEEQKPTGPGRDGEPPWWSSKSWKKKGKESGVRSRDSGKKKE